MKISFITSMAAYQWGGSEELWYEAARALRRDNHEVSAYYPIQRGWHHKLEELVRDGVSVRAYGLMNPTLNGWAAAIHGKLTGQTTPSPWPVSDHWRKSDLVVVSQGGISDGLSWLEAANKAGLTYTTIIQANMSAGWPDDVTADRLRRAYTGARRVHFVSDDNLRLFRIQVADEAHNAEVIWNPLNQTTPSTPLHWPTTLGDQLNLAMVGRIEPFAKGQDLALEAFADERIRKLPISLSIYGDGPWSATCQRNIARLELNKVAMCGSSSPSKIWNNHHALLLPSRHEGTSLVMLEALWLGRPVLTTAVAGALSEIIDGTNGFFIADTSVNAVTQTLLRAWEARNSLEQLGSQGAEHLRARMPADPGSVLAAKLIQLIR